MSQSAPTYKVDPYKTTNIELFRDSTSTFSSIRVVVHKIGQHTQADGRDYNHVSTYLLLDKGGSVRINMMGQSEFLPGDLDWTLHKYQLPNSQIIYWDIPMLKPKEVGEIFNLVMDKGLHRYNFVKNYEKGQTQGCRYWTYKLIENIAEQNWIEKAWPEEIYEKLSYEYTKGGNREAIRIEVVKGKFLTDEDWRGTFFPDEEDYPEDYFKDNFEDENFPEMGGEERKVKNYL